MKSIKIFIKKFLEATLCLVGVSLSLILILMIVLNILGLLFGFDSYSTVCRSYRHKTQSNLEYYFIPITPYACKENGGFLQPALGDILSWFGETHT